MEQSIGETITIRTSWYWPELGGVNCASFINGECISKMSSGLRWQDYVNYAIACPPQWSFHTKLVVNGKTWECLDRGGAIQYEDGLPWVDFLQEHTDYPYGSLVDVILIQP
jgi:hypothetical protein